MLNRKSNLLLGLVLLLLGLILFFTLRSDKKKGDRNFKKDLVSVDTSRITKIIINPETVPGEEVILEKRDGLWKVNIGEGLYADMDPNNVAKLMRDLNNIDSKRIVTRSKDKFETYKVNDSGTRVKAMAGSKKLIEMIIGKSVIDQKSIQGASSTSGGMNPKFISYMRLLGEDEVYSVDGFLEGAFNQSEDGFRIKTIWKGNKDQLTSINFNYPDSAFQLIRQEAVWTIDNRSVDSTEVAKYINALPSQKGGVTMKNGNYGSAFGTIDYNFADGSKLTYTAYKNEKGLYGISSSALANAVFQGTTGAIYKRLFVSRSSFNKK